MLKSTMVKSVCPDDARAPRRGLHADRADEPERSDAPPRVVDTANALGPRTRTDGTGGPAMRENRKHRLFPAFVIVLAALTVLVVHSVVRGASHREAPLIALDPAADNTDVYAFVSYDAANL